MDSHCDNPSFSGAASDATREVPDRMRDKPGPRRENILVAVSGAAIKSAIDFTDAVAISQLLFLSPIFEEERSRYVDIGMKHVLVGSAAAKFVGGCLSGYDVIAHTATYEALPFLQRVVAAAAIEHAESHANRDGSSSNERENADPVAATAIVAACLVSVISGFFMAFVAKYTPQVVKLLKMLPYSVKVGIEAVIGWNVLALAFELPTGVNWTTFGSPMEVADFCTQHTLKIVTVVCLAVCLRKIEDIWDSSMSLIVFFVGSSAAIHGVFSLVAMNSSQAQDQGWLFPAMEQPMPFWELHTFMFENFHAVQWGVISGNLDAIIMASMVGPVLNVIGDLPVTETVCGETVGKSTFLRELFGQGMCHLCSGLCLGFSSDVANEETVILQSLGARTKLSVYLDAAATLALFLIWPAATLVGWIPTVVCSAIIAYSAFDMIQDTVVSRRSYMGSAEHNSVVLMFLLAAMNVGQEVALMCGMLLGTFVFVGASNDTESIMYSATLSNLRSSSLRNHYSQSVLTLVGHQVRIYRLRGTLFYGNSEELCDSILSELSGSTYQILLIDFTHIELVDAGAANDIKRLRVAANAMGKTVFISGVQHGPRFMSKDILPDYTHDKAHIVWADLQRDEISDSGGKCNNSTTVQCVLPSSVVRSNLLSIGVEQREVDHMLLLCTSTPSGAVQDPLVTEEGFAEMLWFLWRSGYECNLVLDEIAEQRMAQTLQLARHLKQQEQQKSYARIRGRGGGVSTTLTQAEQRRKMFRDAVHTVDRIDTGTRAARNIIAGQGRRSRKIEAEVEFGMEIDVSDDSGDDSDKEDEVSVQFRAFSTFDAALQSCEDRLISSCSKLLIAEKRKRSCGSINPKFDKLRLLHECLQQAGTYASSARVFFSLMYSGVLTLRKLEPGELLFHAGSSRHAIHFLLMGHVVGVKYSSRFDTYIVAFDVTDECVPLSSRADVYPSPYEATAFAKDSSIVMQIEMDDLERLQSERPHVAVHLLKYMLGIEAAQAAVEANYRQLDNPMVGTPAHVDDWLKANKIV